MKKTLLLVVLTASITVAYGQKSVDDLFNKYAGNEGFVTVTISGDLFKLAGAFIDNDDIETLPANITEIRILAQEDDDMDVENFYDMVINDLNVEKYEEFMRIKEAHQDLRMLVRADGRMFKEFLLIAGGKDNAVIQIKGNMSYKEARKFSDDAKKNNGLNIVAQHR